MTMAVLDRTCEFRQIYEAIANRGMSGMKSLQTNIPKDILDLTNEIVIKAQRVVQYPPIHVSVFLLGDTYS